MFRMNSNKRRKEEFERLFKETIESSAEARGRELMEATDTNHYEVPSELDRKMKQFIGREIAKRKQKKSLNEGVQIFYKVSAYVLITFVLCLLIVPNIAIARNWVTKLVVNSNKEYASFFLETERAEGSTTKEISGVIPKGFYYPSYLPDTMELTELHFDGVVINYLFQDKERNFVRIEIHNTGSSINIDQKELGESSRIQLQNVEAIFSKKDDVNSLIWNDNETIIILISNLSENAMIDIGNGMTKMK